MRIRALTAAQAAALATAFIAVPLAHAETIQLSRMDSETATYIQRGNQGNNVECYWFILDRLEKRGIPKKDIYVTFDDPDTDGIGIGLADTDANYSCEHGELRVWSEEGKYVIERKF
ncbi:hypothetical protein GHK47_02705 [Sinorhizobium meliloti]|nr:hypothetical protein [Sinorhizobium meliloti]